MDQCPFERLVTIQATSPLLSAEDLGTALERFEREQLDSLLSAVRTKRFFWHNDATPINYDPLHRPRRQDFPGTLMENGAFYITRRAILETYNCRLGGRIGIHEMSEDTALEIDEPADWDLVGRCLAARDLGDRNAH
jgi:N-acylneuraminate cytidylyltransferase